MTHDFFKDSDVIDFCLFVLVIYHQGNLLNILVIFLYTKVGICVKLYHGTAI